MRVAVFGVGAVGGYFGGRLAQAGYDVTFIARGATLEALRQEGLQVESLQGDFTIWPVQATGDPRQVEPVDVVIVAVKSWQVPEAAEAIRPLLGPETAVLPLQNGVEAPDQLAAALGREHVLGGLCRIIASVARPGHVRHLGMEPAIAFGELDNRLSPRVEALYQAFVAAGLQVEVPADIVAALWDKFLFVTAWGGVGAVTRAPVGVIRSLNETRQLLLQALQEIEAVAQARGVTLPAGAVAKKLAFLDSLPPAGTTSMQRDIAGGRPSELEAQTGAVVRLGRAAGVPTPANTAIYHSLLPLELRARGELVW